MSTALPFYLTRQSAHKAEALDFLRFVTSVEGNGLFSAASQWMPQARPQVSNAGSGQGPRSRALFTPCYLVFLVLLGWEAGVVPPDTPRRPPVPRPPLTSCAL